MEINGTAQTIVTSGVIFAALVLLGRWVFEWFAKRVEEKDAQIYNMVKEEADRIAVKDAQINEIMKALFEHTAASTHAINELVRTNDEHQKKVFAQHDSLIERIEGCPLRAMAQVKVGVDD